MKKKFTLLIAAFALLITVFQPGRAWGQTRDSETVSYGWETSDDADPWTISDAIVATSGEGNNGDFAGKINTNSTVVQFNEKVYVTSFSYAFKRTSNNNNYSVYIETSTDGSTWSIVDTQAMNTFYNGSYKTVTKEFDGTQELYVRFRCNNTTAVRYVDDVTITYATAAAQLDPCDLTLTNTSSSLVFDLYDNSDAQVINYTTSSTGEVTVSASDYITSVVDQVNKTITVTPVAVTNGTKVITVNQAADDNYAAGSKTFTINITDSTPFSGGDVTFDATVDKDLENTSQGAGSITKSGVTFACDNGILGNGSEYRMYKNSVTTFTVSEGTITQVVFTGTSSNPASGFGTQTGWTTNGTNGTWTGNANEVTFTASGAQVRATMIVVTVDLGSTPDPTITADDVNIAYDATSGSIEYTINNGVDGGTLTAATESDWLTLGTVGETVPFTCSANDAAAARTATVTLTYTYNTDETVTKDVTVMQAGNPNVLNNISDITEVGSNYHVRGMVVATSTKGFVICDGTGLVYTYLNAAPTWQMGDFVQITGTTGSYGHIIQFTSSATIAEAETFDFEWPEITVITEIPDYTEGYHLSDYFQFEGTLTKSSSNYLVAVGEGQIRISYPTTEQAEDLETLVNKTVRIHGFFTGYSGSGTNAVFTVMMESYEEVVSTEPTITLNSYEINATAAGGNGEIEVTFENFTDLEPEIKFFASDGQTEASYDWITAVLNTTNDRITYEIDANDGAARNAYFKVFEGSEGLYSDLVTVTQAAYVAPGVMENYELFSGTLVEGDYLIVSGSVAMKNTVESDRLQYEDVTPENNAISTDDATIVWHIAPSGEYWTIYSTDADAYAAGTGVKNKAQLLSDGTDDKALWTVSCTETYEFVNKANSAASVNANLRYNSGYGFACYSTSTGSALSLYRKVDPTAPSITVAPSSIEAESTGISGTLDITIANMTITDVENQMSADFFTVNGEPISGEKPDWIEFEFHLEGGVYSATYTIANNTTTSERNAYFKIYGLDDDGDTGVYSNLVSVTQEAYVAPLAAITVAPATVNALADETEGNLTITLDNIIITEIGGGEFDLIFCDNAGDPLPNQSEKPDWFGFDFPYENDAWSVYYLISENTTTDTRTAYFKIYGLGDDGTTEAYSNLVTVTQEGVSAPVTTGTITFGSADGSTAITVASVDGQTATDNMGNTWTITTVFSGETSFTQNAAYSQVGASSKPAESITFTTTLPQTTAITAFEAKFGGFSNTAGDINLLVDDLNVGSGALNATSDVTVTSTATATGTTLTVTVTNIAKGVKCYYISYTVSNGTDPVINAPATVNLESDATAGEIAYTIINPATGVSLTAASTDSWISNIVVTDEKVSFTTTANTETTERQGTITLSYTGATDKEVTVTQAAYVPPVVMENYALFTGDLVEGDYIIYYNGKAMKNTVTSGRLDYAEVTTNNNVIATDDASIIWHIAPSGEYWTIYSADANAFAASTGAKNKAQMLADGTDDKALWTATGTEVYEFENKERAASSSDPNNKWLRNNGTYGFACYATSTGGALTLYKKATTIASYDKTITAYTSTKDNYYLIASPVSANPDDVAGMTEGTFDLYAFDQAQNGEEWRNYEAGSFYLTPGKGYLYAKNSDVTLSFNGMPYEGNGKIDLAYSDGVPFAGWNLIGNPFVTAAMIPAAQSYYTLNTEGSELIAGETNTIAAMEGIFVRATAANQSVTFTPQSKGSRNEAELNARVIINLKGNNAVIDRAIIRFSEGDILPKFMLNQENTKLYIPQDNEDYAVVRNNGQGEMPVNFKAANNGTYTLSLTAEDIDFSYLHLIDNLTGNDVDLLATPSYTFDARYTDYASRFKLVFNANNGDLDGNFAFISDGNIIINGTDGYTTVQVIDALGRIIVSTDAMHCVSTDGMTTGMYMIRLINGNDVKTQKIIVK